MEKNKLGVYLKIGDNLKKYRAAAGYTQREFAQRLGVPVSTYSNYENGNRVPNAVFLEKAASELNVSVRELISVSDNIEGLLSSESDKLLEETASELDIPKNEIIEILKNALNGGDAMAYLPKLDRVASILKENKMHGNSSAMTNTEENEGSASENGKTVHGVRIPVLGTVAAGLPIEAVEDILDFEEIPQELANTGEFFALQLKGNSMEPRMCSGDVVIVRQQPDVESGEIAVVLVNGNEATVKKLIKKENGIMLQAFNPVYEPIFYSAQEIEELPVRVIGKVIELRGKF